ncbi:hypothetical protein [Pantoea leporis]|uniref:hypothetical protein n=1 Tax=Pantoea leporis TaxID=2933780 RepID=UPI002303AEE3|nr:hypothetical protein [Pantoea leporis]
MIESYIYETTGGLIGYFQDEDGNCRFFPYNYSAKYIGGGSWKTGLEFERILSGDPESFIITQEMIHEAMSLKIREHFDVGAQKIIKTSKVTDAGSYFPRINRNEPGLSDHQINTNERADEIRAYDNIAESLVEIFRTIEPEQGNFNAYGNRLREQLIVACTEVEYLLQRTVIENGKKPLNDSKDNYTTKDYIWCLPIQKLNEYVVELPSYPSLGSFSPFKEWSAPNYSKSLSWYNAYNKVKHNRGGTKHLATFEALINAVAAIHILLEAQYGKELFEYRFQYTFRTIFHTSIRPEWSAKEICVPILQRERAVWEKTKHHP